MKTRKSKEKTAAFVWPKALLTPSRGEKNKGKTAQFPCPPPQVTTLSKHKFLVMKQWPAFSQYVQHRFRAVTREIEYVLQL